MQFSATSHGIVTFTSVSSNDVKSKLFTHSMLSSFKLKDRHEFRHDLLLFLDKTNIFMVSALPHGFCSLSLIVLTKATVTEKVFCYLHISSYYCNSCDQNPWKISFKKLGFRNEFLEYLCKYNINPGIKPQILEHIFWRTVPLAASDPCSILVDNT